MVKLSLVEINMREAFWHTNGDDYFEHNFIFESDDFFLRIDTEGVSLYFDDKTKRLIENFYQRDEPNLKYNSLSLVEAGKNIFGELYVSSFIESVKVNGSEVFNIKNYEVELSSREGSEFVEISLSAPRMGLVIKKRQIQQT